MIFEITEEEYDFLIKEYLFFEEKDPEHLFTRRINSLGKIVYKIGKIKHDWDPATKLLKPLIKTLIFNEQLRLVKGDGYLESIDEDLRILYQKLFPELENLLLCSTELINATVLSSKEPSDKRPPLLECDYHLLNELDAIVEFRIAAERLCSRIYFELTQPEDVVVENLKITTIHKMMKYASLRGLRGIDLEASS